MASGFVKAELTTCRQGRPQVSCRLLYKSFFLLVFGLILWKLMTGVDSLGSNQECRIGYKHFHSRVSQCLASTGHSRYVDFAYLDTITYVEVIFHSQHFFSIFLCISTPYMSKTVNTKQWVSRGDFSCPRYIFYYIC